MNATIRFDLWILMVVFAGLPSAGLGTPDENQSCTNCHNAGAIRVTTSLLSTTATPGAKFSLTANWTSGGSATTAKWPSEVANNGQFNPSPVSKSGGTSGSFTANFTAPASTGNYSLQVFAATVQGGTETCSSQTIAVKVAKTNGTVTLGNLTHTYNGTAKSATATTVPAGMNVTFTYNGSASAPINVGNYTVVGTINNASYQGNATGQFVISKANTTVTLGNLTHTYNGTAKSATATTVPAGMNVTFTYNGSASAPINVGNYTVVGTINNASYQGNASGQFIIAKANGTVTLGNLTHTYNGTAKSATATTTPPGLTVTFTYNGSASAPTNVGSYHVVGTISNANYQGSGNGTLSISAAPSPLADFRAANGLAANGSQDLLIPAGDGVTNLEKYAFNMIGNGTGQAASLNIPNHRPVGATGTSGLPSLEINGGNSTLTYVRRKASTNPGITYVVEYSDTLAVGSWAAYAPASQTPVSIDTNYERVSLTDSIAPAPRRFFRVRITTP
jgi:hypothetical protein